MPVVVPAATVPVMVVALTLTFVTAVEPIVTLVAPDKRVPCMVMVLPGQPVPVTLVIVGVDTE